MHKAIDRSYAEREALNVDKRVYVSAVISARSVGYNQSVEIITRHWKYQKCPDTREARIVRIQWENRGQHSASP